MHTISLAVNGALLQEIERSRGTMTRSAYLSGLIRAALDAKLTPLPTESFRGRLRHSDRLGGFRRAIARKGEVRFEAFADLFARMLAPVEVIRQGPESIAWAANQLINEGLFEWAPSGTVRIPLGAPRITPPEENTLAGWSEIILDSTR